MAWNYISINRSIFDRKKFQITVGPSGPSVFRKEGPMRYHYEKPELYSTIYGYTYRCDHPVYNECTLFKVNEKGLAIVQQRFDSTNKLTYWTPIDPGLQTSYIYIKILATSLTNDLVLLLTEYTQLSPFAKSCGG